MPEVNLSRIHSMIKTINAEIYAAQAALSGHSYTCSFQILEKTTDEDFAGFKKRLEKEKGEFEASVENMMRLLDYVAYLKDILDDSNRASGVSKTLLKLAAMQARLARMKDIHSLVADNSPDGFSVLKNVDYYKSAYTENVRTYSLAVPMFDREEAKEREKAIKTLEKAIADLNNELSALNQTTRVAIMDFDEFCGANFRQDILV